MADFIQVPPNSTGEKVAIQQLSDGLGNTVDRQEVILADDTTYAARAKVQNAEPSSTDYAITTRRACVGSSIYHVVAAATTNAANIKASPGRVTGWSGFNNTDYPVFVKFHDTAGTPTAGSGVVYTIGAQAGQPFMPNDDDDGLTFTTGIGITIVTGIADTDATAVALNDCVFQVHYK